MKNIFRFTALLLITITAAATISTTITSVHALLTDEQAIELTELLERFTTFTNASAAQMGTNLELASVKLNSPECTSLSPNRIICPTAESPNPPLAPTINWASAKIPASTDYIQVKPPLVATADFDAESRNEELCAIAMMIDVWRDNFANSSGEMFSQYFTQASDGLFAIWPASNWTCSEPYEPLRRPFYVSGATGPKDVAIVIDLSTADVDSDWRIEAEKRMAIELVQSLSFRDYVVVVPFASSVMTSRSTLTQASADNVQLLVAQIAALNVDTSVQSTSSLGEALDYATKVLGVARERGTDTSRCTQLIVVMSSGTNDKPVPGLDSVLTGQESNETVVFSFLFLRDNISAIMGAEETDARRVRLSRLACTTKGVYSRISSINHIGNWTIIPSWLSQMSGSDPSIRISEHYLDLTTAKEILSISAPVYETDIITGEKNMRGVVTTDVPLEVFLLNGTITPADVNAAVGEILACSPMHQHDPLKASIVEQLQSPSGTCDNLELPPFRLAIRSIFGGIVTASVFGLILLAVVPCYAILDGGERVRTPYFIGLVVFFIASLIWISTFWSCVWPEILVQDHWVETKFVVEKIERNPYTCCDKTCSFCDNLNSCASSTSSSSSLSSKSSTSSPSTSPSNCGKCATMMSSLTPGTCDDGYVCCQTYSYSCRCRNVRECTKKCTKRSATSKKTSTSCTTTCRTVQRCSTCRRCTSSINHRQCSISCGTCYRPTAYSVGDHKGRSIVNQQRISCKMNDMKCVTDFEKDHAVGSSVTRFVNPENPQESRDSNKMQQPCLVASCFFAAIAILALFAIYLGFIRDKFHNSQDEDQRAQQREKQRQEEQFEQEKKLFEQRKKEEEDAEQQQQQQQQQQKKSKPGLVFEFTNNSNPTDNVPAPVVDGGYNFYAPPPAAVGVPSTGSVYQGLGGVYSPLGSPSVEMTYYDAHYPATAAYPAAANMEIELNAVPPARTPPVKAPAAKKTPIGKKAPPPKTSKSVYNPLATGEEFNHYDL